MLKFPAIDVWRPGEIAISWTNSTRRIVPEIEKQIDETWARAMARPGVHLFDGPMCRLESFEAREGKLSLILSRTSYKPFVGTNLNNSNLADKYGCEILANPVGLSTVLISADGFLLLGRRNARVAYYPNRVHPFAGCLEPADRLDVFDDARRELREELSLEANDLTELVCTGIAQDISLGQPEICFAATTNQSAAQIESQLDAEEHTGIWKTRTSRDEVESALKSAETFTPVAIGAILLWGRVQFGDAWFETRNKTWYDPNR